ncbi:ribonuclease H-like domain-containing protein [Tanacetum coccineum]
MAYTSSRSSSNSDSEVDSCSKSCVKVYATLKEQYDSLSLDYKKSQFNLVSYKVVSPAVESFVNSSEMLENDKSRSDKGYHTVPLPLIGTFTPAKPDLIFIDEQVKSEFLDVVTNVTSNDVKTVELNHELVDKSVFNIVEANAVRMNNSSAPIIKDWNSDDESEVEPIDKDKTARSSTEKIKFIKTARETVEKILCKTRTTKNVNTVRVKDTTARERAVVTENKGIWANAVKASACWDSPQQKVYKEKGVIDSGCSRHMTGNKCYLTEYEDYNGGFVSFRDSKGRISRKGKIKTGTLDFDDVYFCNELKYNLFSVSQICDKKNYVLFTDIECLVLSSDFMLLDESQVLLRVPRKDNIYSVDLKSVVPTGGLTCLFAKVTIDESNIWHRRLRCPVTILNTRDHLGKFDGKGDEGYFVGYYVVSKAMRVFNKRTRIVEKTLNIRFLENSPNVKGNGPDWLFYDDFLTISMNYVPVVIGNQTNGIAGTKDNIATGQAEKKREPE